MKKLRRSDDLVKSVVVNRKMRDDTHDQNKNSDLALAITYVQALPGSVKRSSRISMDIWVTPERFRELLA